MEVMEQSKFMDNMKQIIDWRFTNQDKYLKELTFRKSFFDNNEHAHCEFCWKKFSKEPSDLHSGYCSVDKKFWICENCFNDFKNLLNLKEQ